MSPGPSKVVSLAKSPTHLASASRRELMDLHAHYRQMGREWIRREILYHDRIDILAKLILGYDVQPFHLVMMQFQFVHPKSLQLAFRGAGKSTICTVTKCIHLLLKDPNLRIILSSKTTSNAKGFLKEIKSHFESNQRLADHFGVYYDPSRVSKWDDSEIEIVPRTRFSKEPSISCCGVDSTIVSRHVDIIISDDLVDEENTRTQYMRDKARTWYYQTLDPCLEPPDLSVPHRGEHHHLGTRYHYDDLYGHLLKNDLAKAYQVIPALDEQERSPWPEKYPPEWFQEKKEKAGLVIFNAQYQCDTEAMRGEVYQYDDCQIVNDSDVPDGLRVYMGVDLSVGEKERNDQFAIVVIGEDISGNVYVLDRFAGFLRFSQQLEKFDEIYRKHDPILAGIEVNAYQKVFYQEVKEMDSEYRVTPIYTDQDKLTRAWKLSPMFENKKMFFRKGMNDLIDQLVLFPNHPLKDLWDALDLAVRTRRRKKRKRRESEPGLI